MSRFRLDGVSAWAKCAQSSERVQVYDQGVPLHSTSLAPCATLRFSQARLQSHSDESL